MNTLITRKIVFGLLATLVLAFSMQGIADALTFRDHSSNDGDLRTLHPNDEFTIRFTAVTTTPRDIFHATATPRRQIAEAGFADNQDTNLDNRTPIDSSGYKLRGIDVDGTTRYYRVSGAQIVDNSGYVIYVGADKDDPTSTTSPPAQIEQGDRDKDADGLIRAEPDDPISDSEQHHYNDEAILVVVTGGTISSLKRGNTDIPWSTSAGAPARRTGPNVAQGNTYSLIEETRNRQLDTDRTLTSSQVTLTGQVIAAGTYTIKIYDVTHLADFPANAQPTRQAVLTFTIYVVPERDETTALTRSVANEYKFALDRRLQINTLLSSGTDIPLRYEVEEGPGRIYPRVSYTDGSPVSEGRPDRMLFTSSAAPVFIDMNRGSSKVSVYIQGQSPLEKTKSITFIYNYADLNIIGGDGQVGATGGRLEDPLSVKVTDANNRPVPGLRVTFDGAQDDSSFIPFPGETVYITNSRTLAANTTGDNPDMTAIATSSSPNPTATDADSPIYVQTDSNGEAKTYYQLGETESETQDVDVTAAGITKTFTLDADDDARRASLQMVSMVQPTGAGKEGIYYLTVIARSVGGHRIPNVIIEFEALSGSLRPRIGTGQPTATGSGNAGDLPTGTSVATSGNEIFVITGSDGEAEVEYNVGPTDATKVVTAEVHDEQGNLEYDFVLDRVTFDVQHATSSRAPDDEEEEEEEEDDAPSVTLDAPFSVSGTVGSTVTLTFTADTNVFPTVGRRTDTFLTAGGTATFPTRSGTTYTSTLTLPSTTGNYRLTVDAGTQSDFVTVIVTDAQQQQQQQENTLRVSILGSGGPGTRATVRVTATDANNNPAANVTVTLNITTGGGTFLTSGTTTTTVTTGNDGTATAILTRGTTPGSNYYVTASAQGYTFQSALSAGERLTFTGTQPGTGTPGTAPGTTGPATVLDDYDGNNQMGSLNSPLPEPLVVEVVDANDNPVENVRVRFRTTIGDGRFSPRTPRTDEDGLAATRFTPTSAGRIRIVATVAGVTGTAAFTVEGGDPADALVKVSGDNQSGTPGDALANPFVVEVRDEDGEPLAGHTVTFEVTAGGGSLSETSDVSGENGRAQTTLTLGSEPGINSVQASVSGVDPVTFSTSIDANILVAAANRPVMYWIAGGALYRLAGAKEAKIAESANGVAVGGGKVYWTTTTGASSGTINSANLDGSNLETVTTIMAVPMGIAVDTAGSKLYWTNSRGRIQSANLNGSGIQNVLQNLTNPTDIVVSGGFIYWTQDANTIRRVNISGQRNARDVAANLDTVGGLSVGGGKVYWTEQTSASAGTVNGANLNGTNFETLATLLAAPMGISVDVAGSKLYWTNSRGRVQSANLNGSGIRNVVTGLISPTKLVIGGANVDEAVTRQPAQPAQTDTSVYDVNGDGVVDGNDKVLVLDAVMAGTYVAKYDVNDDKNLDILDYVLVDVNIDAGAAGAPTLLGMKLSTVQIDRLQEQIDLLIATGDRSPAAMRTLTYLQQLIATARPEKTQLLANYPNPFNPETWIPYELATDTNVRITIYNTQGVVIRTLEIGHQSAGYYTGRDRAVYWDGRNALGEQVASGIYFYQFETDDMSAMRKMVILK